MANTKKYVSFDKLSLYDEKIKKVITDGDAASLQSAKDYADSLAEDYEVAGAAAVAEGNAKAYTDAQIESNLNKFETECISYIDGKAADAFDSACGYTDDEIKAIMAGCDCFVFAAGIDERVEFPAPVYDAYYKYNIAPLKRILPLCKEVGMKNAVILGSYFSFLHKNYPELKTGWYSGREEMDSAIELKNFNYIKLGPYIEERGPLSSPTTNQRVLQVLPDLTFKDITYKITK